METFLWHQSERGYRNQAQQLEFVKNREGKEMGGGGGGCVNYRVFSPLLDCSEIELLRVLGEKQRFGFFAQGTLSEPRAESSSVSVG